MSTTAGVSGVEPVAAALERGAPVEDVLDLADEAIERAIAERARTTLVRLAGLLADASVARPEARGLAVAATRARAAAAAIPLPPAAPVDVSGPPERPRASVRYSGWWRRVGAFTLDWVILFSAMAAVPGESDPAIVLAVFVLPLAYFAGLHAYADGRTVGKWVFGIAVRDAEGELVSPPSALGRAVAQCLLWLTVVGGVVDSLLPLGDERRRSLHDRIAGTVVVRVR